MNNYVSFLLEADAAKRRLAQLFESEALGRTNSRSTAFVACDSNPTAGSDKNSDTNETVKLNKTRPDSVWFRAFACVTGRHTARPVFWLLIGSAVPFAVMHPIGTFLQQRVNQREGLLEFHELDR